MWVRNKDCFLGVIIQYKKALFGYEIRKFYLGVR